MSDLQGILTKKRNRLNREEGKVSDLLGMYIRIDEELHKRLAEIAKKEERPVCRQAIYFVRKGIEEYDEHTKE